MGEVHLALDTRLGRKVAIKLLPDEFTADAGRVRRFEQEARAASALNHPNIITIYELGETVTENGSLRYIVTEFVEGETLRQRMANAPRRQLELSEAIDVASQVAAALSAAHEAGILHRDIKPENVMARSDGIVKVLDFGLAKLTELEPHVMIDSQASTLVRNNTEAGVVMGTPRYMSPEQARGEKVDSRTDIFSLGVMLYEMVAGVAPFTGASVADILVAILERNLPPLAQHASGLPAELEQIVSRCLAKRREHRYQSAKELLSDLKAIAAQSGQPRLARSSSPSIAVLPFVNMSADAENEYFCDGLAEELINALSKIEALRVVARTTAFSFKGKETDVREIGRKLNVGAVVEGGVRKAGDRLRITAQLINVADGYHLWAERYDRRLEDIFDIQDEISMAIVDALKLKLLGSEKAPVLKRHTDDAEAYQLYLKGRYFWLKFNPEGWMKSRACFEEAVRKDPNFALAYSGLSDALGVSAVFTPANEVWPKAKEAALRALKLDPSIAEAWNSKAGVRFFYEWDWAGAESDCRQSIELNPHHTLAHDLYSLFLSAQGRFDEAIREARKACELDPLSAYFNASVGFALYYSRRYDEATEQFLKGVELDSGNLWPHMGLVEIYEQRGMYPEALHHRQTLLTLAGNNDLAVEIGREFQRSGYRGVLLKCLAESHRQSQLRYVSPLDFARIYALLGELEMALDWLEKACSERTMYVNFLKVAPTWDSLHSTRRYADLLRRIGLSM